MDRFQPDISQAEFERILSITQPFAGWKPIDDGHLQWGAWFEDENGTKNIRLPWKKAPKPITHEPTCPDGQTIAAHDTHLKVLEGITHTHNSILDVGGYDGIWAWLFAAERKVVLDVCCEALERWAAVHADEIVCEDGKNIGKLFSENEFDVVLLADVLEHMHAPSALACILAAEKIARYQVVVATPDGWQPWDDWQSIINPPDALEPADVPCAELMAHKSGWGHEFFENRGYEVTIQPGLHEDLGLGDGLVAFFNKGESE